MAKTIKKNREKELIKGSMKIKNNLRCKRKWGRSKRKKRGFYELYIKRPLDFVFALLGLIFFSPAMLVIAVIVWIKLGSPVIFVQKRPGLHEKIFKMYKFRSMSDAKDKDGNLLPDGERLGSFGKVLRATSLDELPELINILKRDMSVVGPRPQLVRDMVFMSSKQRMRHDVRPGLSGLAQVNGRNSIGWEEKLEWDLKYINKITFSGDMKIVCQTIMKAFIKHEGINEENMVTAEDYGDYLLQNRKIDRREYSKKQLKAKKIIEGI